MSPLHVKLPCSTWSHFQRNAKHHYSTIPFSSTFSVRRFPLHTVQYDPSKTTTSKSDMKNENVTCFPSRCNRDKKKPLWAAGFCKIYLYLKKKKKKKKSILSFSGHVLIPTWTPCWAQATFLGTATYQCCTLAAKRAGPTFGKSFSCQIRLD